MLDTSQTAIGWRNADTGQHFGWREHEECSLGLGLPPNVVSINIMDF
jgi:hypothetical protein